MRYKTVCNGYNLRLGLRCTGGRGQPVLLAVRDGGQAVKRHAVGRAPIRLISRQAHFARRKRRASKAMTIYKRSVAF